MPEGQEEASPKLPPYRRRIQPLCRCTYPAAYRKPDGGGEPSLSADDTGRAGPLVRPALYTSASSEIQGKTDSGLRHDQILGQHTPRMFRRLRVLHHFCPSGKIHRQPEQGKHPERGKGHHRDARLQGLSERFGRAVGQHVPHGREGRDALPQMQTSVVCPSENLSEPEHGPPSAARHLPRRRRIAGHQEKLHRKRCALRLAAAQEQGCGHRPQYGRIHTRADSAPRERTAESGAGTHERQSALSDAETFV